MNDKLLAEWKTLVKQIKIYDKTYDDGEPLINDDLYDCLKERLIYIESIIGIQKNSPLYKIRGEATYAKIQHKQPMLSLDHGFGVESMRLFLNKIRNTSNDPFPLIAEHKIDGISLSIRYNDGDITIVTRGNGIKGTDVTQQMQYLDIPRNINENIEVRGELYIKYDDFKKISDQFSSPRNFCASLLQNKCTIPDTKIAFAPHNVFSDKNFKLYSDKINYIKKLGFNPIKSWACNTEKDCINVFEDIEQNMYDIEYAIDGVVFKINSLEIWDKLGSHNTAPRYAFARKFNKTTLETTITDIKFQVGKFGTITPVAIFDTIKLFGVNISRATMHNICELEAKNYGIGDKIGVSRAGDCSPYINYKTFDAQNPSTIKNCPSCGCMLKKSNKTLICENSWNCEDQKIARIQHFCSLNAFNISGVGLNVIKEMVEKKFIEYPSDIFDLPQKITNKTIIFTKGWDTKSINNLIEAIKKSKNIDFVNFIYSLCIPNVGYGAAKSLAKYYNNLDLLIENQQKIHGIGEKIIDSINQFFQTENKWIIQLKNKIIINYD